MSHKEVYDRRKAETEKAIVQMIKDGCSNEVIREKILADRGGYYNDMQIDLRRRKLARLMNGCIKTDCVQWWNQFGGDCVYNRIQFILGFFDKGGEFCKQYFIEELYGQLLIQTF